MPAAPPWRSFYHHEDEEEERSHRRPSCGDGGDGLAAVVVLENATRSKSSADNLFRFWTLHGNDPLGVGCWNSS